MNSKTITYILIVLGAVVAVYAQAEEQQNSYFLIGGFAAIMIGLYRLSRGISSNTSEDDPAQKEEH